MKTLDDAFIEAWLTADEDCRKIPLMFNEIPKYILYHNYSVHKTAIQCVFDEPQAIKFRYHILYCTKEVVLCCLNKQQPSIFLYSSE